TARFWVELLQIMGINILLSGDNAVVIALASRSLPEAQRKLAVMGGSAAAIVLRIIFCLVITSLLRIPYLKVIGGLLLLLGLAISIPLIVFGSQLVLGVLNRFPILVMLGGGLLGWIAGEIIVSDPAIYTRLPYDEPLQAQIAEPLLALLVMAAGRALSSRARAQGHD